MLDTFTPQILYEVHYYQIRNGFSDVPGLQISGFGRAGLDPFGLRAGRAFLHRASGFFSGFLKTLNTALFI